MKPLIIANLKSHKLETEIKEWVEDVEKVVSNFNSIEAVVAPPFPYLNLTSKIKSLKSSSQDVSPFPSGSYTGAVNAEQLKDFGVKYCIVGHSERRKYFHETNQQISNKIDLLTEHDITPIVCVDNHTFAQQIAIIEDKNKPACIFAYEPASSIGSGNPADPQLVEEMARNIQGSLGNKSEILYGGSIDVDNINEYLNIPAVNGFIIGTSALNPKSFIDLLRAING